MAEEQADQRSGVDGTADRRSGADGEAGRSAGPRIVDDGGSDQRAFLLALRRKRVAEFRKDIFPYMRYVFQSGFGLGVSIVFFAALVWYIDLIRAVPANWPADWVGMSALTIALALAPLRVYMLPADPVFLLAMEREVERTYIREALRRAIWGAVLRTALVSALYLPIYARAPMTEELAAGRPLWLLAALFAALAVGSVAAGWRERQAVSAVPRAAMRAARWGLTALTVAALLLKPLLYAVSLAVLCALLVWGLSRLPASYGLPWERQVAAEERTRRRWIAFLGWFVDVPAAEGKPAARRWIAWAPDRQLWRFARAWHFLYGKTFVRGETFGAYARWTVIAAAALTVTTSAAADIAVYAIAVLVGCMQLGELRRVRFVETSDTLPVPPEGRMAGAAAVAGTAGLCGAALLAAVWAVGSFIPGLGEPTRWTVWVPVVAAALLWSGWVVPRRIARRRQDEDDV